MSTIKGLQSDADISRPPCLNDVNEIARAHPGIVCISVPSPGKVDIAYDPEKISRREVRAFVNEAGETIESHLARCTMPLQGTACEACGDRIRQRLQQVSGVKHATVSFNHGSVSVVFDKTQLGLEELVQRVRQIGVPLETSSEFLSYWHRFLAELDSTRWQKIMVIGAGVAIAAGFALSRTEAIPAVFTSLAWISAYVLGGYSGLRASISSLRLKVIDVDVLMILAAIGAAMINAPGEGALLLFLFSLSNLLQDMAVGKARGAIASLLDLRPPIAQLKTDVGLVETPVEQISPGEIIVLRPGDRVPLDGEVVSGFGSMNQASVTGESIPVEKAPGDSVFAGTLNQEGSLEVRVTRPASDSTLARMISLVESAQSEKAVTQHFLERAEQYYAVVIIALTIGLAVIPPLVSDVEGTAAFYRAITVLVVASPCALVLSTPAAILSAIAGLGRRGILVKGGRHLEDGADIGAVAFDKTGTLTIGRPVVTDVNVIGSDVGEEAKRKLIRMTAEAEGRSEHPLAIAVIQEARRQDIELRPLRHYNSITGRGGEAILHDGTRIVFGSIKLMRERECSNLDEMKSHAKRLEMEGKTVIAVARDDGGKVSALGLFGLQDVLRPEAKGAIARLRQMGIEQIVMVSGDTPGVANAVAAEAGIDIVYGGLMPEEKVRVIRELSRNTPVMMVGDGINDAPALAAANLGAAMGAAGTDVAMETADVVLMAHDIEQVPVFLQTARKARRVIGQNLIFSISVVLVLVVIALGFELKLSLGVLGHEGSTVLVCLNGLRLLREVKSPGLQS